jgi:hypothetical protein
MLFSDDAPLIDVFCIILCPVNLGQVDEPNLNWLVTTSTSMRSRVGTYRPGTHRASSKGRFVYDALSKGRRLYVRGNICRGHFTTLLTNVIINPVIINLG